MRQELEFEIPTVKGRQWHLAVDTAALPPQDIVDPGREKPIAGDHVHVRGSQRRRAVVAVAARDVTRSGGVKGDTPIFVASCHKNRDSPLFCTAGDGCATNGSRDGPSVALDGFGQLRLDRRDRRTVPLHFLGDVGQHVGMTAGHVEPLRRVMAQVNSRGGSCWTGLSGP